METHLEYDRARDVLWLVSRKGRIEILGVRPQERQLVRFMAAKNHANGEPVVCSNRELCRALWPGVDPEDSRGRLARLVLDLRRRLTIHSGGRELLVNLPREGYILMEHPRPLPARSSVFSADQPVYDPARFFGRGEIVERIFELWDSIPMQHAAVIGPRRSGKTSLLHYLPSAHSARAPSIRPRFATVDFQNPSMRRREHLLPYLLRCLQISLPEPCNLEKFTEAVATEMEQPAVILLDSIEAAHKSEQLDWEFWSALRYLGWNTRRGLLGFVVAMRDLSAALSDDPPSPFLNSFGHVFALGPLTEAEARSLIRSAPDPVGRDDEEWMLAESEGRPALLQVLCEERLRATNQTDWRAAGRVRCARIRATMGPAAT